jgi:hypothetical protein
MQLCNLLKVKRYWWLQVEQAAGRQGVEVFRLNTLPEGSVISSSQKQLSHSFAHLMK